MTWTAVLVWAMALLTVVAVGWLCGWLGVLALLPNFYAIDRLVRTVVDVPNDLP